MYGIVYKITNKINNKVYIGQTVQSLKRRWIQHLSSVRSKRGGSYCTKLRNAILHYGIENFEISNVANASSKNELDILEDMYIKRYDSIKSGYNLRTGGHTYKYSEESRKRMSDAQIGRDSLRKGLLCNSYTCRPCIVRGFIYPSIHMAAICEGVNPKTLHSWLIGKHRAKLPCEFLLIPDKTTATRKTGSAAPKPCVINGVTYPSLNSASKILKRDRKILRPKALFIKENTICQ